MLIETSDQLGAIDDFTRTAAESCGSISHLLAEPQTPDKIWTTASSIWSEVALYL
jgi:hypothetical protein